MNTLTDRLSSLPAEKRKLLLKRLAEIKEQEQAATARLRIPPLPRAGQPFELSFAQERLWFLDRLMPGSAIYNMSGAVRVTGPLNLPALERTFTTLVERHESLRTTFAEIDGSPVQQIMPATPVIFTLIDLQHAPEDARGPGTADGSSGGTPTV